MLHTDALDPQAEARRQRLVDQALRGDRDAWGTLCTACRESLKQMIELRLHPRVRARIDASDVIQEAYLEAYQRLEDFRTKNTGLDFLVWLRLLVNQQLALHHRRHLGTEMRDARCEWTLGQHGWMASSSASMAHWLATSGSTPSQQVLHAESLQALCRALEQLDDEDRELLALRHFERLTNEQVAQTLGWPVSSMRYRYARALQRMRRLLD